MNRAIYGLPWILALGACTLAACTLGPNFTPPSVHTAPGYAAPGEAPPPADQHISIGPAGAQTEADWWTQFHSRKLDDVMALANAGNQNIKAATARVAQAREEVNAAEGALLPQLSLDATAGRQKYGVALFGPANINVPAFTYYSVGPSLTMPLDLFGANRRKVEETKAYKAYQGYQLDAAMLSLTGSVAAEALAIASARAQIAVLQNIVADDRHNIALVQTSLDAGTATRTQLLSAQSQMASDQTLLPELQQQESAARHALAILVGKAPADWVVPDFNLTDFTLPAQITAGLPSELLHRRPDIRAAEAELHMASAAIGVATANLYPQIDLTGTLLQEALMPGNLFNASAAAWSIAANLTQPLYDGGQLSAKRRATLDGYQASLASYRQTILISFGQVADQLQALSHDADQLRDQNAAAQISLDARDLARRSYSAGNSGILDVIDAERRAAQAQLGLSRATAQRLLDTARLYVALGGTPVPVPKPAAKGQID